MNPHKLNCFDMKLIIVMLFVMYIAMYVCFIDLGRDIRARIPKEVALQTEKYSYQVMVLERENEGLQLRISELTDSLNRFKQYIK